MNSIAKDQVISSSRQKNSMSPSTSSPASSSAATNIQEFKYNPTTSDINIFGAANVGNYLGAPLILRLKRNRGTGGSTVRERNSALIVCTIGHEHRIARMHNISG